MVKKEKGIRILVTIDKEKWQIIENIKGLGGTKSEKINSILTAYLNEKSYIKEASSKK